MSAGPVPKRLQQRGTVVDPQTASTRYEHGTLARYVLGKCRCLECRVASAQYYTDRRAATRKPWRLNCTSRGRVWLVRNVFTGEIDSRYEHRALAVRRRDFLNLDSNMDFDDPSKVIDAKEVRSHIFMLMDCGLGKRAIAKAADVSVLLIEKIRRGSQLRTRRSTAEQILAVEPSDISGGASVESGPTLTLLNHLREHGYRPGTLARMLGSTAKYPTLQIKGDRVLMETMKKVWSLYIELQRGDSCLLPIGTLLARQSRRQEKRLAA